MELLKVENLCKVYGKRENEVKAVDDVSFSVPKEQMVESGRIFCIIITIILTCTVVL